MLLYKRFSCNVCSISYNVCIFVFFIFIVFGNALRIIPAQSWQGNFLITEIFVGLSSLLAFFFLKISMKKMLFFLSFAMVVIFSTTYGTIHNGFNFYCFLYAPRLVMMVFSSMILGEIFYQKFSNDVISFFKFFVNVFLISTFCGFLIYFFLPNSIEFWLYLQQYNITFNGDPHQGRFISMFFDPNFYATIAIMPLIMSCFLLKHNKFYSVVLLVFLISVFLTISRSGIGTGFLTLMMIGMINLKRQWRISFFSVFMIILFFLVVTIVIWMKSDFFIALCHRFIYMMEDPSAASRFNTMQKGIDILSNNLLLGTGYNYLERLLVDSSVIVTFITFGSIISIIGLIIFLTWSFSSWQRVKKLSVEHKLLQNAYQCFYVYLLAVIVFSCQFNDVLYMQFWLILFLSTFSYLLLCVKKALSNRINDVKKGLESVEGK